MIEIDDRKGAVYEKIIGKTMLKEMFSKIWEVKKQAKKLAQIHFSIQQKVDFELPVVKEKLKKDIKRAAELSDDEKTYLYQYIEKLPDGNCLCHFDFHPDNIMFQNGKAIIIDWMTAAKGDPLADVARTSLLLKYGEIQVKSKVVQNFISIIKRKILKEYRKEYLRIANVKAEDIDIWELPIAAARLCEWIPIHEKQILLDLVHHKMKELSSD
jgi:thiamine kinase-like enzyme